MKDNPNDKIRILSLFSGCGGLDLGFLLLGQVGADFSVPISHDQAMQAAWAADSVIHHSRPNMVAASPYFEIVAAIEHDEWAAHSYERNIGPHIARKEVTDKKGRTRSIPASILDLNPADYGGKVDIIIGGPPCPDFSLAGKRAGVKGKSGGLVYTFAEWVAEVRPGMFIMENVEGLRSMYVTTEVADLFGVREVSVPLIDKLTERYQEMGYKVECCVLDAADYGVPQYRRRIILVGTLPPLRFRFPEASHAAQDDATVRVGLHLPHVACGRYLEDLPAHPNPPNADWLVSGGKHPAAGWQSPSPTIMAHHPMRGGANWATVSDPNHLRWLWGKHPASIPRLPAFAITARLPQMGTSNWLACANAARERRWDRGQTPPSVAELPARTIAADGPLNGSSGWLALTPAVRLTDGWRDAATIGTHLRGTAHPGSVPQRPSHTIRGQRAVVGGPNSLVAEIPDYAVGNRFNGVGNTNRTSIPAPAIVAEATNMTLYRLGNRFAGYGGERGMVTLTQPAPTACNKDDLTIYITQQSNLLAGHGTGSSQHQPSPAVGAENPLRLTIRNRIAERGDGSDTREPAPAVTAHPTNMSIGLQAVHALKVRNRLAAEGDGSSLGQPAPTVPASSNTVLEPEGTRARARRQAVRPLTVRECARLQTFPEWFKFASPSKGGLPTRTAMYRQVGNAVPVALAMRLAKAVVDAFAGSGIKLNGEASNE